MNKNQYDPNKNPVDIRLDFEKAELERKFNADHASALKSAKQGQYLASHVLKLVESGRTESRAKLGPFPRRYPVGADMQSVTLAANAELKPLGVTVDTYDAAVGSFDSDNLHNVVVTNVGGEAVEPPSLYKLRR